jgi:hypothetical protein
MNRPMVLLFLVGCATGAVGSNLTSQLASAQAPPPGATRWQYKCFPGIRWSQLDQIGAQGWEMVTYAPGGDGSDGCFKRPLPAGT